MKLVSGEGANVGKSSLLNCLTKTKIAKTSKTPGRTKSLNFFEIPNKIRLVDFPWLWICQSIK